MTASFVRGLAIAATISLISASCSGDGSTPPPTGGVLVVSLSGAKADDGAVLFEIGSGATSVSGNLAAQLVHIVSESGGYRIVVLGPLQGTALINITTRDVSTRPALTLLQVAASDGTLRTSLTGYSLQVNPAP